MDDARRRFLTQFVCGAGLLGLRSLATGLPMSLLAHPHRARAAEPRRGDGHGVSRRMKPYRVHPRTVLMVLDAMREAARLGDVAPTNADVAFVCGVSRATVIRTLNQMQADGLVQVERIARDRRVVRAADGSWETRRPPVKEKRGPVAAPVLTERQRALIAVLRAAKVTGKRRPKLRVLARHLGYCSSSKVSTAIARLAQRGLIERRA